jgi:hypothetical protein
MKKPLLLTGFHLHHIIPRHAGGTDEPGNLVLLHPIDHAIWHLVMGRMNKSPKDLSAGNFILAKLDESGSMVDISGEKHHLFGTKRPRHSELLKGRSRPTPWNVGRPSWNSGKKTGPRPAQSKALTGRTYPKVVCIISNQRAVTMAGYSNWLKYQEN